jgi:acyl-CoA synthetase (AMP-forming)/AMP-acid ligase II
MDVESPTIPAFLHRRAARSPALAALVHDDDEISYRELDERSRALAARLVAAGVGKHSRVGVLMPNGIDWATVAYAALRIGAVLVPLSTLLKPPELEAQLRSAAVAHLVTVRSYRGRDYRAELASLDPGLQELGTARLRHARLPALRHVWPADALPAATAPTPLVEGLERVVRPADDLAVLFTSGSRGAPKGTVHTHGNALRAVASGLEARCVRPGDRLYIPMPFFWTGGFGAGLLTALVAGATLLTESDPSPARTIAFLARRRATLFRGWPDQAAKVASDPSFEAADLSSLRPGSLDAVLPRDLRARPGARANLFGMTETFGPYCGARLDRDLPEQEFGSCGQPFAGIEVRIVDPESREPLERGRQGEIEVRGANLMRGICGRLREATFTRDGFYPTGDLGILDADGYLFYAGRTDDMFKVSGATVYPAEVEAALRTIPGVAQAYVTNLPSQAGELVGAAVVTRAALGVEDLEREARARLSSFKVPKRWLLLGSPADVPSMATGKVDKPGLQELLRSAGRRAGSGSD